MMFKRCNISHLLTLLLSISSTQAFVPTRVTPFQSSSSNVVALQGAASSHGGLGVSPIGIGSAAPAQIVTNDMLETVVETNDEWIRTRTGIGARCLLRHPNGEDEEENIGTLAVEAVQKAMQMAGKADPDFAPEKVSHFIYSTSSAQDLFGDAGKVAHLAGCTNAMAFDLTAACSGFLFGTVTASHFLHVAGATAAETAEADTQYAIVVGADALSRWVDWEDRNSCVLFGDGAGAMVLKMTPDTQNLKSYAAYSNGAGSCDLHLQSASEPTPINIKSDGDSEDGTTEVFEISKGGYSTIKMNGKKVYSFATREVPRVLKDALDAANMDAGDIDWLLLHQANIRIMQIVAKRFDIPMEKVLTNLESYGNTSAASIPLCLDEFVRSGKVKKGDKIACAGFGAGLSWGASVIIWDGPEEV